MPDVISARIGYTKYSKIENKYYSSLSENMIESSTAHSSRQYLHASNPGILPKFVNKIDKIIINLT